MLRVCPVTSHHLRCDTCTTRRGLHLISSCTLSIYIHIHCVSDVGSSTLRELVGVCPAGKAIVDLPTASNTAHAMVWCRTLGALIAPEHLPISNVGRCVNVYSYKIICRYNYTTADCGTTNAMQCYRLSAPTWVYAIAVQELVNAFLPSQAEPANDVRAE